MARVQDLRAVLIGGGSRNNQFRVELSFPNFVPLGALAGQRAQFLCHAASLPGSVISEIPVPFRGRTMYVSGEREFQPWTISIYNDTTFGIRNALEFWSNGIQNLTSTDGITNPSEYQIDMAVHQLDRGGATLKTYKFNDAWPIDVSPIQLSYEQANSIETFDVTFRYNFWDSNTSEGSGFGVNVSVNTPVGTVAGGSIPL